MFSHILSVQLQITLGKTVQFAASQLSVHHSLFFFQLGTDLKSSFHSVITRRGTETKLPMFLTNNSRFRVPVESESLRMKLPSLDYINNDLCAMIVANTSVLQYTFQRSCRVWLSAGNSFFLSVYHGGFTEFGYLDIYLLFWSALLFKLILMQTYCTSAFLFFNAPIHCPGI